MSTSVKPADIWNLPTNRLGRRTLVFARLDSTNSHAALLADDPGNDGIAILAREQTAGRGQHGRVWTAPAGSSVLLSVLLFPPPALRRPTLLTAWAAIAVCETITQLTDLSATIKWPNDVLIDGRKVCGILIEQRTVAKTQSLQAGEPAALAAGCGQLHPAANAAGSPVDHHLPLATICGIGLNLNQSASHFQIAGLEQAGSLATFTRERYDCGTAARLLIHQLDQEYERLCQVETQSLESRWAERLNLLDRVVVAECADGERHGRVTAIGWDAVHMEAAAGTIKLLPETIRHLRPE
jgi:BirA family biotin operon repressor/biotin-[acetyl-CoA-carboxylase] ligase